MKWVQAVSLKQRNFKIYVISDEIMLLKITVMAFCSSLQLENTHLKNFNPPNLPFIFKLLSLTASNLYIDHCNECHKSMNDVIGAEL